MVTAVLTGVVDPRSPALVLASAALVVIAGAAVVVAAVQYRRYVAAVPPYLRRERLRAYSAIMAEMIALNRLAVELDEENRFDVEKHRYAMSKDSVIEAPVADLTETIQRHYHVLDPEVRAAADDYLDFLSVYEADPTRPPVATLLDRSRRVVTAMRADLGLSSFGPDPPTSGNGVASPDHDRRSDSLSGEGD
jgi:hypothetical protein